MPSSSTSSMPAVFFGHGNPMIALEDNVYTRAWRDLAASMPTPSAIVAVSAHWTTRGTAVAATAAPQTIHDFHGFPQALFDVRYPAPGDPALAARIRDLLAPAAVQLDHAWGLDHGVWSVLLHAYPQADVPVVQLSLDLTQPAAAHFALGQRLAALRNEGVLLMASGNVVHNLRAMQWHDAPPYDWARRFNDRVRACIEDGDLAQLADYAQWDDARMAVPTPEHFLPLLYIAGARRAGEPVAIPVDAIEGGSISMLSMAVGIGAR